MEGMLSHGLEEPVPPPRDCMPVSKSLSLPGESLSVFPCALGAFQIQMQ